MKTFKDLHVHVVPKIIEGNTQKCLDSERLEKKRHHAGGQDGGRVPPAPSVIDEIVLMCHYLLYTSASLMGDKERKGEWERLGGSLLPP